MDLKYWEPVTGNPNKSGPEANWGSSQVVNECNKEKKDRAAEEFLVSKSNYGFLAMAIKSSRTFLFSSSERLLNNARIFWKGQYEPSVCETQWNLS